MLSLNEWSFIFTYAAKDFFFLFFLLQLFLHLCDTKPLLSFKFLYLNFFLVLFSPFYLSIIHISSIFFIIKLVSFELHSFSYINEVWLFPTQWNSELQSRQTEQQEIKINPQSSNVRQVEVARGWNGAAGWTLPRLVHRELLPGKRETIRGKISTNKSKNSKWKSK